MLLCMHYTMQYTMHCTMHYTMHCTMHSIAHLRSRTLVYPENEHSMFLRNVDVYIPN